MQLDIILTFRKQNEHTEQIISSGKKNSLKNFAEAYIHATGGKNPVADSLSFFQKLNLSLNK
jgi:hypothetical protein